MRNAGKGGPWRSALNRFIITFLFISCGQEPEILDSLVEKDEQRLEICGKTRFQKDILKRDNVENLFQCAKWDKKFPHLFKAIKKLDSQSWDHFVDPIDEYYFSDLDRRDQYFRYLKELDRENGLDDLGLVIKSLMSQNIYDAWYRVLYEISQGRNEISQQQVMDFFKELNIPQEKFNNWIVLFKDLVASMEGDDRDLKVPLRRILESEEFKQSRREFVTAMLKRFVPGHVTPVDRKFLKKIMTETFEGENKLYRIFRSENYPKESFLDLLLFKTNIYPKYYQDFRAVQFAIENKVKCKNPDYAFIELDIKPDSKSVIDILSYQTLDDFLEISLAKAIELREGDAACGFSLLNEGAYEGNLFRLIETTANFLSDPGHFNLIQWAHRSALESTNDHFYFMDFITGEFHKTFHDIMSKAYLADPTIIDPWYLIFQGISEESYPRFYDFLNYSMDPARVANLEVVFQFWNQFTDNEKEFALNIIDSHFKSNVNYMVLLRFYAETAKDLPGFQKLLFEKWGEDEQLREKSFNAILSWTEAFQGVDILNDIRRWYDRDHILEIIRIISQGVNENYLAGNSSLGLFAKRKAKEIVKYEKKVWAKSVAAKNTEKLKTCLAFMSNENPEVDFYFVIRNLPAECQELDINKFSYNFVNWLHEMENDFNEMYPNVELTLFDEFGLLGRSMLASTIVTHAVFQNNILDPDKPDMGGNEVLVRGIHNHLYKLPNGETQGFVDEFLDGASLLALTYLAPWEGQSQYVGHLLKNASEISAEDQKQMLADLGQLYVDMANIETREIPHYPRESSCSETFSGMKLGRDPCPSKQVLKQKMRLALIYIIRNFSNENIDKNRWFGKDLCDIKANNQSTVEGAVEALIPGGYIMLPFCNEKQRKVKFDLATNLRFYFDVAGPEHAKKLEYKDANGKKEKGIASVGEQIEVTIRDILIHSNSLIAYYVNEVAKTQNYSKTLNTKYQLFKICRKLRNCNGYLNKEERRLIDNVLDAFDGLKDVDKQFKYTKLDGTEYTVTHNDYVQSLLAFAVRSSSKESQVSRMYVAKAPVPYFLGKEKLKKHNVGMVINFSELSFLRNTSRWVRDRFGGIDMKSNDKSKFQEFLESEDFIRVNKFFLKDLPRDESKALINNFIFNNISDERNSTFLFEILEMFIDWISERSYDEIRYTEKLFGDLVVISTYLNGDNNLFKIVKVLDKAIELWPILKSHWPKDLKLFDLVKELRPYTDVIRQNLSSNNGEKAYAYRRLVNKFYDLAESFFLDQVPENEFAIPEVPLEKYASLCENVLNEGRKVEFGIDSLINISKNCPEYVIRTIRGMGRYLDALRTSYNGEEKPLMTKGRNLINLGENDFFSLKEFSNLIGRSLDPQSKHYQELPRLLHYMTYPRDDKPLRLKVALDRLFTGSDYQSLIDFFNYTFGGDVLVLKPQS